MESCLPRWLRWAWQRPVESIADQEDVQPQVYQLMQRQPATIAEPELLQWEQESIEEMFDDDSESESTSLVESRSRVVTYTRVQPTDSISAPNALREQYRFNVEIAQGLNQMYRGDSAGTTVVLTYEASQQQAQRDAHWGQTPSELNRAIHFARVSGRQSSPRLAEQLRNYMTEEYLGRRPRTPRPPRVAEIPCLSRLEQMIKGVPWAPRPYSLLKLLTHYRSDCLDDRGNVGDLEKTINPILDFFEKDVRHFHWAENLASHYLAGCINQATHGWLEIIGWAQFAQNQAEARLESLRFLAALYKVRYHIGCDSRVPVNLRPEAMLILLRGIAHILQREKVLPYEWHCLPVLIPNEHADNPNFQQWLAEQHQEQTLFSLATSINTLTPRNMKDFVEGTNYTHIWGPIVCDSSYGQKQQALHQVKEFYGHCLNIAQGIQTYDEVIAGLCEPFSENFRAFYQEHPQYHSNDINVISHGLNEKKKPIEEELQKQALASIAEFFTSFGQECDNRHRLTSGRLLI